MLRKSNFFMRFFVARLPLAMVSVFGWLYFSSPVGNYSDLTSGGYFLKQVHR